MGLEPWKKVIDVTRSEDKQTRCGIVIDQGDGSLLEKLLGRLDL